MENSVIMVSRVRFRSPQNISGASQQNGVEAFSCTTEAEPFFEKHKDAIDKEI